MHFIKKLTFFLLLATVSQAKPNVLLICIDDLRPELGCYGVDYMHTPNIDRLADQSHIFTRHYVQAASCGPSRYTLLTGRYGPPGNNALFMRSKQLAKNPESVPPSMPEWFREHSYTTVSVGKVSHHPGGRGGANWNSPDKIEMPGAWDRSFMPSGRWQHPRGAMHGLANGEIRITRSEMAVFQSADVEDEQYPDGLITNKALAELKDLKEEEEPFFLAVGIIRPHLPFGAPAKYMEPYRDIELPPIPHPKRPEGRTTWHKSGEFMTYNLFGKNPNKDAEFADEVRKHYAACVTYADAQVGKILDQLEALELDDDTIVVLWGDHGWHLGEHAIWGKHALFEESLRAPLIIHNPSDENGAKEISDITETLDIFPTLCELAGLPKPDFLVGESLAGEDIRQEAYGYGGAKRTIRTDRYRFIVHPDGYQELYDHDSSEAETRNIAETNPEIAEELLAKINERLPQEK